MSAGDGLPALMRQIRKEMMSVGNRKRYMQDSFHERLRCLWLASGLTQKQVAERIGAERKSVSKWISGEFNPNLLYFMRLCRLFHVSADWLLFGEEEKDGGQKRDSDAAEASAAGNEGGSRH